MSTTDPNSNRKSYESELDPQSLKVVRGKYSDLQSMIESLNDKLNLVSEFQEKEFLSAYRVHMLSVQLELKELQEKVAKAEMLLQDDGEVSKLEEECNWFRNETNRLQTHSSAMQHDIQALKTRLGALQDQNKYLSSQLKAVMKRSRVLEVEIDLTKQNIELQNDDTYQSHYSTQSQQNKQNDIEEEDINDDIDDDRFQYNMKNNQLYEPNYQTEEPPLAKSMSAIALGTHQRQHSPKNSMRRVQSVGSDALIPSKSLRHTSPSRGQSNRNTLTRKGRNNQNQNEKNYSLTSRGLAQSSSQISKDIQSELHQLQKQLNTIESSRCYVELELENQIRSVFQNVIKRKSLTVVRNSKNRYFYSLAKQIEESGQDSIDQELEMSNFSSKTPIDRLGYPIVGGITNLGLEHLTDVDRKEVMINLLSNTNIFMEVVQNLGYTSSHY